MVYLLIKVYCVEKSVVSNNMDDLEEIGILHGIQNIIEAEVKMDLPPRTYNSRVHFS